MNTIKFDLIECWTINRFLNMKLTGLMKIVTLFYIMFLLMQQQSAIKLSATDVKEFHMTTNEGDINNNNKNNNNNSNNNNNTNNNKNKQMALNSTNINYCLVKMNNATILKELNSKWTQEDDPCLIHYCELQAPAHKPLEIVIRKNCTNLYCDIHSEIRPKNNTCCGECVRTKCLYQDKFYEIGQKWYDDDNCILFECINNLNGNSMTPEVNSYRKYCSPLPANCAVELIYTHDCCQYCNQIVNNTINTNSNNNSNNIKIGKINSSIDNKQINHFVYATLNNNDIWTQEFYRQHLCVRECHENEPAKICEYTFVVEWYETLSNACYNCPHNISDCQRPHCVAGDGIRRAITVVNRMMPGPEIQVCQNDIVVVNVRNNLLGDSTTIHWHGMHMKENPYMDGVPHITQCPISPHATFRYIFRAKNSGTHFWHSHTGMQRGDGVFGAFIVKKPRTQDPHHHLYDFDLIEHKMTLQDWIHVPGVSLFTAHHHSQGDNKPINLLINGKGRYYPAIWQEIKKTESFKNARQSSNQTNANYTVLTPPITLNLPRNKSYKTPVQDNEVLRQKFENKSKLIIKRATMDFKNLSALPLETFHVHSGYRYRFRIINAEFLNCPIQVSIDNHTLLAINSDGYDLEAADVGSIVTYAGERFDFILNANQIAGNYWIRLKGLMDCDERFTSAFQVAILHYIEVDLQEPSLSLHYDHQPEGITLNALNRGSGHVDSLTIAEINSLPINDHLFGVERKILKSLPDYKFFIYYDFYGKDNPTFHPSEYYSFNATLDKASRLLTPQLNHISFKVPSIALLPARDEIDENIFCNETSLKKGGVNCRQEFCQCLHVLQVPLNAIIELILVDEGFAYNANHPFHLHGTAFRVLAIEKLGENVTVEMVKELDRQNQLKRNLDQPPIKDTVTVPDGGYTIVRFEASNPGYWLLHCHIEFHAEIGMALVLKVGNNNDMPPIPKHFPSCYDYDPLENDTLDNNSNAIQNSKGINKSHSLSTILQIILFIYLFKKILLTIFHVVNN